LFSYFSTCVRHKYIFVQKKENAEEIDQKQYRRRKIESNWSRYTEISSDEDDDMPTKRGEDFNKVFAEAGTDCTITNKKLKR